MWAKFRDAIPPNDLLGHEAAKAKLHVLPGMNPDPCTPQEGRSGPWHLRLPHFRMDFQPSAGDELQAEFFVRRKDAAQALECLEFLAPQIHPLLLISEIRTIAADEFWLSPFYSRDTVAIHFTFKKEEHAVQSVVKAIENALEKFEARPHWGKVHSASSEYLESVYPQYNNFRNIIQEVDPQGKYRNDTIDALLGFS